MRAWRWIVVASLLAGCERAPKSPDRQAAPAEPTPAQAQPEPPAPRPAITGPVDHPDARAAHEAIQHRQLGEPLEPSAHVRFTPIEQPEALADFYAALRELDDGRDHDHDHDHDHLRIAVYGSSNIAGDRFTGYLRGYLQARFGDGGPGFVAAVPLWRWHRHQEITLDASRAWTVDHALRPEPPDDGRWGLMGVRASTRARGARIQLRLRGLSERIERWEVWHEGGGGSFDVRLDGGPQSRVQTSADGPGYVQLDAPAGARQLSLRTTGDETVRLFGAVLERATSTPGVVVDELGIGGSGARRWLQWAEQPWAQQIQRRDPVLVILAYGGIESMRREHDPERFAAELDAILDRLERTVPAADCLLIGPQDRAHKHEHGARRRPETLDGIIAIERRVAAAHGCAFFDTQAMMGGPDSMPTWVNAELARDDHVHFSPRGYAHMGRVFVDALLAPYDG